MSDATYWLEYDDVDDFIEANDLSEDEADLIRDMYVGGRDWVQIGVQGGWLTVRMDPKSHPRPTRRPSLQGTGNVTPSIEQLKRFQAAQDRFVEAAEELTSEWENLEGLGLEIASADYPFSDDFRQVYHSLLEWSHTTDIEVWKASPPDTPPPRPNPRHKRER